MCKRIFRIRVHFTVLSFTLIFFFFSFSYISRLYFIFCFERTETKWNPSFFQLHIDSSHGGQGGITSRCEGQNPDAKETGGENWSYIMAGNLETRERENIIGNLSSIVSCRSVLWIIYSWEIRIMVLQIIGIFINQWRMLSWRSSGIGNYYRLLEKKKLSMWT